MKIFNLNENSTIYTSNVFLALGEWNAVNDVNTLIDVGMDESIFEKIEQINTGLGKKKVDQVILTHSHSDHTGLLQKVIDKYKPEVYAFNAHIKGITDILGDGDKIKIGEKYFEVFHITAHSYDSICLLSESEGILFAGDTTFPIEFENTSLEKENADTLNRLCKRNIRKVYLGHGTVQDFSQRQFRLVRNRKTKIINCESSADL